MRIPSFNGNVIVSNLAEGFTAGELAALFDDYGLVLGAVVNRSNADGTLRGMVILAPEPAVDLAITSLNGREVAARKLKVRRAPPAAPKPAKPKSPEQIAEAVRVFRSLPNDQPVVPLAPPAPVRKVIVEYRSTRRFEIPSRAAMGANGTR
jgi:RNA recognition motif-containing protein